MFILAACPFIFLTSQPVYLFINPPSYLLLFTHWTISNHKSPIRLEPNTSFGYFSLTYNNVLHSLILHVSLFLYRPCASTRKLPFPIRSREPYRSREQLRPVRSFIPPSWQTYPNNHSAWCTNIPNAKWTSRAVPPAVGLLRAPALCRPWSPTLAWAVWTVGVLE